MKAKEIRTFKDELVAAGRLKTEFSTCVFSSQRASSINPSSIKNVKKGYCTGEDGFREMELGQKVAE